MLNCLPVSSVLVLLASLVTWELKFEVPGGGAGEVDGSSSSRVSIELTREWPGASSLTGVILSGEMLLETISVSIVGALSGEVAVGLKALC